MELSKIKHEQSDTHGKFYIGDDKHNLAELTYSKAGDDKLIIDHTWVDPKLRNQGIGEQLVEATVAHAREENLKVIPLCTFAKSVFDNNTKYNDVLMESA